MRGTVERITRKGGRTALRIGGEWYSTFEPVEVGEGDRVEFSFKTVKKNGREYKNLKTIEVIGTETAKAAGDGEEPPEAERIARSVALKCAVEACGPQVEPAEVLATAEAFLGFLLGSERTAEEADPF